MISYVLEDQTGGLSENYLDNDTDAALWAEQVLARHGYNKNDLVSSDWDYDGWNDDFTQQIFRMLFWADEESSLNDSGSKAIASLSKGVKNATT